MTYGLLFGGRSQPADGGLTLQAAHALFQALQIDVVCRLAAGMLGRGIGRAALAEGRPARALRDWRFPELQRAVGEVGEIRLALLVARRHQKAWWRRIIFAAMRGISGCPVSFGRIRRAN
jgi:hypothetical protein